MTTGERIKKRRRKLSLSVEEVAKHIGKSRATVYRYENGEIRDIPITVLGPLALILKCSPEYLVGWTGHKRDG